MRSHFLTELSIGGKESILTVLPNFDFYNLRRIARFDWTAAGTDTGAQLILTAVYESHPDGLVREVVLSCSAVRQLRVPELGSSFFLAELEVEDVSGDQMEGVRYKIKDFGESSFEILCGDVCVSFRDSDL